MGTDAGMGQQGGMGQQDMGQQGGMGGMGGGHHHKDHHKRHEAEAAGENFSGTCTQLRQSLLQPLDRCHPVAASTV